MVDISLYGMRIVSRRPATPVAIGDASDPARRSSIDR
jgi:hypothetical protein